MSGSSEELDRLRVENEQLRAEVQRASAGAGRPRAVRRRRVGCVLLVILGSTLLPVSVLTVWVRNQVLDTDRYVATVEPLASDPTIRSALVARISERISAELDLESLARESLPEDAAFLAGPIASGADSLIEQAATRVVRSEQFASLWVDANRAAHDGLVVALTGEGGDVVAVSDGKVVLRLGAVVAEVLERIDDRFGADLSSRVPTDRLDVEFVLVDSAQLADVQAAVRWLDRLSWLSLVATVALLSAAVAVSPDRRRGVAHVGLGVTIAMVVLRIGFAVGRDIYLTNLPDAVQRPDAAAVIFDTLTRYVLQATRVIFVVGLVLLVAGWLAGGSAPARAVRDGWNRAVGRGSSAAGSTIRLGPVPAFVARHLRLLRGVVVAAAVAVLLIWDYPTGRVVAFLALATLVPLAVLQLVAGMAPIERNDGASGPAPPAHTAAGGGPSAE